MLKRLVSAKSILFSLLLTLTLAACGTPANTDTGGKTIPTSVPPLATPTVDLTHAREAFDSGGELTYEEVEALRLDIVGDPAKFDNNQYRDRQKAFAAKLEKCKLKETIGWVAGWRQERDDNYKVIPDKNSLYVYLYNPFYGLGKELQDSPEMLIVYLTDKQTSELKYGQRIKFSGVPTLVVNKTSVKDPRYTFLEDDPPVQEPTADELKDLQITLGRTMCYGTCPDYTLTIEADGIVTFEGRHYTNITGTVTSTIGIAQVNELAREIKKADFFSLDNNYSADITDLPTYTLTVEMRGQSKSVRSYAASPRRLDILIY